MEMKIPKEIKSYEPKIFMNFTLRQMIVVASGLAISYSLYNVFDGIISFNSFSIFSAVAVGFVGWYKFYGLYPEKFITMVFFDTFIAPKIRRYKIENQHETLLKQLKEDTDPDVVDGDNNISKKEKKKLEKEKKRKYKKSKEAIK